MKKVWWFKRLVDNYYFPIDNEVSAANTLARKDFRWKFEYVGWSDGKDFAKTIEPGGMLTPESLKGEQANHAVRRQKIKDAYTAEVRKAMKNKHDYPRKQDVLDLSTGKPVEGGRLLEATKGLR